MPDELQLITIEEIIGINKEFTSGILLRPGLDAIYASYMYYKSKKRKICSIFLNLVKGHYFADNNKRTSVVTLISIIKLNNMETKLTDENLYDIAIKIAESHLSVEQARAIIFT